MSTQDTTLPPLPEPFYLGSEVCGLEIYPSFTADQMHAYARAAIAAQAQPSPADELKAFDAWYHNIPGDQPGYDSAWKGWQGRAALIHQAAVKESLTPQQAQQAQGVPAPDLIAAAQAVVRDALDAVEVHPCDVNDDSVRAKFLLGSMAALHSAIATAPQAEPQPEREPLTRSSVSDEEIRAWVKRHDLSSSLSIGHYRAMVEDARTIELAGIGTKGGE